MLAKCFGAAVFGVNASLITVEVSVVQGTGMAIVGLADGAGKESQQRVDAAIKNSNYQISRQKTVINLAPADVWKEGASYDLPIALGFLSVSGQIKPQKNLEEYVILGELALDGKLRPIKGVLPIAIEARRCKHKGFILPIENAQEAAIVNNIDVIGVASLQDAIEYLCGTKIIEPLVTDTREIFFSNVSKYELDFSQVQGQEHIKRAMEIAAAGGHNAIIVGSSDADKITVPKRISSILPPLTLPEALETTKIYSVVGKLGLKASLLAHRPFKMLYHSISETALSGGGTFLQPSELALAHNGTLFLEELSEFQHRQLEVIEQTLENTKVTVSNGQQTQDYPINIILFTSINSCPCGNYNDLEKKCLCSPEIIEEYIKKLPQPLLDKIDLHIEVTSVNVDQIPSTKKNETSEEIRKRVIAAREIQTKRFESYPAIKYNAMIPLEMIREICDIGIVGKIVLTKSMERLKLSEKAYNHILKVSRTIADLANSEEIRIEHLAEAIQYRSLDREKYS